MKILNKLFIYLIRFYQKYLSIISFGSCRYHPTCSSYAITEFEKNNFFLAFFNTTFRICRCNPLFEGGFDYPLIKLSLNNKDFKKIKIKYWLIPAGDDKYYIIKNWDRNNIHN
jgi:putative membrane protein insertion efficiency factor